MPFPPRNISENLKLDLTKFLKKNDFVELYKSYKWRNDTLQMGFPGILKLEVRLIKNDLKKGITLQDVKDVAKWGKLRNMARIIGNDIVLPPNTLHGDNGMPSELLRFQSTGPLCILKENIPRGIGPTYLTKVIRFGLPQEFGAIDTRCVRIFGRGDHDTQQHNWLAIKVINDGYGWYIPSTQVDWPTGYDTWIDILRFFSHKLLDNCPHPREFVEVGLRSKGKWTCADIEMALFSFASKHIRSKTHKC
jgi:hypothetical protein